MSSRARITVLLLVLLLAGCLLFMLGYSSTAKPAPKPVIVKLSPPSSNWHASINFAEHNAEASKPIRINTKGTVRLNAGETAVLSYWEIEPGLNGIALVTPETMPDGNIKLSARILNVTDRAVERASAQDMFPDIFNMEHYGAVGPERLGGFIEAVNLNEGADMMSMPTILVRAGMQASIEIGREGGDQLSLGLKADPLSDGGFDLGMDFNKQGTAR